MKLWKLNTVEKDTIKECQYCSAPIKYSFWLENKTTGEKIVVGCECCDNFLAQTDVKSAKKQLATYKKQLKIKEYCDNELAVIKIGLNNDQIKIIEWLVCRFRGNWKLVENYYPAEWKEYIKEVEFIKTCKNDY